MIIAQQKRKENIAEYLLYMYQIEDLIRANDLDLSRIEQTIINSFDASYDIKRDMLEWYKSLLDKIREEGILKSGHLKFLIELAGEINEFHIKLINNQLESEYRNVYEKAKPNIEALRMRSGHTGENDVQVSLNGIYGLLILKLQKREITKETQSAFQTITEMIALLSVKFLDSEQV
jgi:hypothetical protein